MVWPGRPHQIFARMWAYFILLTLSCALPHRAFAASCPVIQNGAPSEAEKALLAADYSRAESLYRAALSAAPQDAALTAGLTHALLRQQKVEEAQNVVAAALAASPKSAALIELRGEVELRAGEPWIAAQSAEESFKLDPCNPRIYLLFARLSALSSLHATAVNSISTAHQLDPEDPEIRSQWMMTLPVSRRIAELEAYLGSSQGDDAEQLRSLREYLGHLEKLQAEPQKPCSLISQVKSTQIPFAEIVRDVAHTGGFGLNIKLNNRSSRLLIDTGANGLLVSSSLAKHAGLQAISQQEIGGVGDAGKRNGFRAYADSIRIGDLEFQNCAISVTDGKYLPDGIDGIIGMDVFSNFLVTLDYPMRKLQLSPLPPLPGEDPAAASKLNMANGDEGDAPQQNGTASSDRLKAQRPHGPYDRYVAPEMANYSRVYRVGHWLIVPAQLNQSKIKLFILDTGAWATSISPQAAREVTKVSSDDSMTVKGISGDVKKLYAANKVTFRFANLSQEVYAVPSFDTSEISKDCGMEISGFLGATTLFQTTIHIDYRDGLVKFDYDPNRGYHF